MEQLKRLIQDIHRRSLWQVLAIYAAASWVVFEVVQTLTEGLGLPEWFPAFAFVLLLIGLPIVLATAFVQEGAPAQPPRDREAASETRDRTRGPRSLGRLLTWRNAILGGLLAFSLWGLVATAWLIFGEPPSDERRMAGIPPDPHVIAVFPFRVSGAESDFGHLREGMVDLLAAKFNGEGGPRAADPRSVIAAWRRVAGPEGGELPREALLDIASDLGAGQILLGGIVGTPSELVLNAAVLTVPAGATQAEANVEGPPDSLLALIDALTARLLVREAGESTSRLASLTSRSLPALRAYLEGQAAYRRGAYADAVDHFDRALELDSTFALAGLSKISAAWWAGGSEYESPIERTWSLRDRLGQRDLMMLEAWAGPRYPDESPAAERLAAWERALAAAPERPEPWLESGDFLFHYGRWIGREDPWTQAATHFRRALELDSTFTSPLSHLVELAILNGEREQARRLSQRYLQLDSAGDVSEFIRWRIAHASGDSARLERLRSRFSEMSYGSLRRIMGTAQLRGLALDHAEAAAAALLARPGTAEERAWAGIVARHLALNRGRPDRARRLTRQALEQLGGREGHIDRYERWSVLHALYWGGDSASARSAVSRLVRRPTRPSRNRVTSSSQTSAYDLCVVGQWRLWHGDTLGTGALIDSLRAVEDPAEAWTAADCAILLDALRAAVSGSERAAEAVGRLDSLMLAGPLEPLDLWGPGNLVLARLWETLGEAERALEAVRRRPHHWHYGVMYLSSSMREEGRLAARVGDRAGAIRAYRHYLTLRSDPEDSVVPEVELVREELARLVADETGP